jgi:hypothetical protein
MINTINLFHSHVVSYVVILLNFRNYVIKLKQIYKFLITMSSFITLTVSSTATYTCIVCWGSSYQEGNCWNVLNWFNAVTFLCFNKKTNLFMMGLNWVYTSFNIIVWDFTVFWYQLLILWRIFQTIKSRLMSSNRQINHSLLHFKHIVINRHLICN